MSESVFVKNFGAVRFVLILLNVYLRFTNFEKSFIAYKIGNLIRNFVNVFPISAFPNLGFSPICSQCLHGLGG